MAFDPKTIVKNPAIAIAGGFLIGMAIWSILGALSNTLVEPLVRAMGDGILRMGNVRIDCFTSMFAILVGVVAIVVGVLMIKVSSKD